MNLRKIWKGTDEEICWDRAVVLRKRIYQSAVSQSLRNIGVGPNNLLLR